MKKVAILLMFLFLITACGAATPAPTDAVVSTPSNTPSASLSEAPASPTPTPTARMFAGSLTTQVNVRSGPGTGYESLGLLDKDEAVQVSLQSDDGTWYRILYPEAPDGFGWVAARYVTFAAGTPFFPTPALDGLTGHVLIRLNVRSGPGTTFETLGMLEAGVLLVLTAKNTTGSWFQIEYPPSSQERGWVTAQYVQTDQASELPVVDEYGQPVSTGTPGPSPIPMTPTPTLGPAADDGDSSAHPAVSVIFSSGGTRKFTYSSQVSTPGGDGEDWVAFTPFASLPGVQARLLASLDCTGNGTLAVELWQAGAPLPHWGTLVCGDSSQVLTLTAGVIYQLRLMPVAGDGLQFIQYSLTVQNQP